MSSSAVLCSTCATSFKSSQHRREHMRSAWHVFNVKRRVDALPSVPHSFYHSEIVNAHANVNSPGISSLTPRSNRASDESRPGESARGESESTDVAEHPAESADEHENDSIADLISADETTCLFCIFNSEDTSSNLLHMYHMHGLFIPDPDAMLTDLATLLSYLRLVIQTYHTCLYCGHEKHSAEAVQAHMLAKSHCQLDLSPTSEYLDFWAINDTRDGTATTSAYQIPCTLDDFMLPSGQIIASRRAGRQPVTNFPKRHTNPDFSALVPVPASSHRTPIFYSDLTSSSHSDQSKQALARRDALGIVGLSDLQRRSLAVTQRKARTTEDRANNRARWILESMGNKVKQKHFKVGSMCRSGLFIDPTMF